VFECTRRREDPTATDVVYDFDRAALTARVTQFIEDYNAEVDRYKRAEGQPRSTAS
jgi:hypothetical protein